MPILNNLQNVADDTPYTIFPTGVDTITRKTDVDVVTKTFVDQYHAYIESNNFVAAAQLLNDHPELVQTLWRSEDFNRLRDGLIAVQRTFLYDVEDYIAQAVKYKGDFDLTTTYYKYDVVLDVTHGDEDIVPCTYIALPADEEAGREGFSGIPTTDSDYWVVYSVRGARGASGVGMSIQGLWDAATSYSADDCVAYNSALYYAKVDNIGVVPSDDPEKWGYLGNLNADYHYDFNIIIPASEWIVEDGTGFYINTVSVPGMLASYDPIPFLMTDDVIIESTEKLLKKEFSFISYYDTYLDGIKFTAKFKCPTQNLSVKLRNT